MIKQKSQKTRASPFRSKIQRIFGKSTGGARSIVGSLIYNWLDWRILDSRTCRCGNVINSVIFKRVDLNCQLLFQMLFLFSKLYNSDLQSYTSYVRVSQIFLTLLILKKVTYQRNFLKCEFHLWVTISAFLSIL